MRVCKQWRKQEFVKINIIRRKDVVYVFFSKKIIEKYEKVIFSGHQGRIRDVNDGFWEIEYGT